MKILLTGASGLFGINFALHLNHQHQITGTSNKLSLTNTPFEMKQVDLGDFTVLSPLLEEIKPDLLIHCAAVANVDDCENHPDLAKRINADLAGELASIASRLGIQMIHLSTDAVFDGKAGNYSETDATNPINKYAETKLAGEKMVADANPDCIIARVNFYGFSLSGKRSLGELFVNQLSAGKSMMGFTDVYFCPFHVFQLSDLLMQMAKMDLKGLYHVVNDECLSKYEFGCRIARKFGFNESKVIPTSWREAGLVANRSPQLTLNVDKLKQHLNRPLPDQDTCLESFYGLYKTNYPQQLQSFILR